MSKLLPYFLVLSLIVSTLIKIITVWGDNFVITPDQGRDLVDIRQMIVTYSPRLVGPTTSINGLLLGPFYYYFMATPFVLFQGSLSAIVFWQIAWFQGAVMYLWFVLRKKSQSLAHITAILLLLSPVGFYTARYFWNANVMPIFTIIFFACLLDSLWSRGNRRHLFLGLVTGLSLQIEAAFGILFFPFTILIFLLRKNIKTCVMVSISFFSTLLPQLLFEIRHQFLMTNTMIAGLSGKSGILGEKLAFADRVTERQVFFLKSLRESNHINLELLGPIFLIILILCLYYFFRFRLKKASNQVALVSLSFVTFSAIFYLFFFSQQIKEWYVLGLSVVMVIFLASVLENIYHHRPLASSIVLIFLTYSFYHVSIAHFEYLSKHAFRLSDDPSNLRNELRAVDWVYKEAQGEAFKVYSYLPSIYDYPYQYLFWWYGTKKYGYQPADIAYLPNQPEYIQDGHLAWNKRKKGTENTPTFIIVQNDGEHQERVLAWSGNFAHLCTQNSINIASSLLVKKLSACSK